jgi:phage shock protein C
MSRLVIDRHQGVWLGVCRGVADYTDTDVGIVRLLTVLLTVFALGLPLIVAYVLFGWLAGSR